MEFKSGDVIPAGYTLSVCSWENDGDNYRTSHVHGLTRDEVQMFLDIMPAFYSKNSPNGVFGNDDLKIYALTEFLLERYVAKQLSTEFIKRFFGITINDEVVESFEKNEDIDDIQVNEDEVIDAMYKWLTHPEYYDYGFLRVLNDTKVFFFKEEFKVPEVNPIQTFANKHTNEVLVHTLTK